MGFLSALSDLSKGRRLSAPGTMQGVPTGRRATFAVDPVWVQNATRYKDKPWGLSYDILRSLALRDSVIAAIITTRIRQISSFWKPASISEDGRGFLLRHQDKDHKLTPVERKEVTRAENFILRCGNTDTPRDKFSTLIKKIVRDRLTLDQVTIEKVRNRRGDLAEFYAVDAATIRIHFDQTHVEPDGYIQILEGQPHVELPLEDMIFAVDNPRSDIKVAEYGLSEIEEIINIVTAHLFAEDTNKRKIQPGIRMEGILWTEGMELTQQVLDGLRRSWEAQLQGVIGSGHVAAINMAQGAKLNYIPIAKGVSDMEWGRWIDYLINIATAVFAIDPAEVNFPNRGSASTAERAPLFEANQETRLIQSRDKGLRPLLGFFEETFTEGIVWDLDLGEDFIFEFAGFDSRTREMEADVARKEVSTYKTVNEYRSARDMPSIPGGDVILDPVFFQAAAGQAPNASGQPGVGGVPSHTGMPQPNASGGSEAAEGGGSEEGEAGGGFDDVMAELEGQ